VPWDQKLTRTGHDPDGVTYRKCNDKASSIYVQKCVNGDMQKATSKTTKS